MFAQFKLMILSIFMAGNMQVADININMDNIDNLKEVACLSQAVQGEAGNQSMEGKIAVAHVIMNRTKYEEFPETPCGVVQQRVGHRVQFDFKKNHKLNEDNDYVRQQMEESIKAAVLVMNGEVEDPTKGALFYANPKVSRDRAWLARLKKIVRIGDHVFYAKKRETHPPVPRFVAEHKSTSEKSLWAGE